MTNGQIAQKLTKAAMFLIEQYKNDKDNVMLQKQLVRKFLTILNNSNLQPEPELEPKTQVRTASGW
jgi:hypothetical protein